jgi:hypothetical protein
MVIVSDKKIYVILYAVKYLNLVLTRQINYEYS